MQWVNDITMEHKHKISAKILVVEDDPAIREFLIRALTGAGYLASGAENGCAALEKIADQRPDLIVTDANMPVMNGFEFCRLLRADDDFKDIPLLFCTACSPQELQKYGIKADAFISKPVEISELCRAIKAFL